MAINCSELRRSNVGKGDRYIGTIKQEDYDRIFKKDKKAEEKPAKSEKQ